MPSDDRDARRKALEEMRGFARGEMAKSMKTRLGPAPKPTSTDSSPRAFAGEGVVEDDAMVKEMTDLHKEKQKKQLFNKAKNANGMGMSDAEAEKLREALKAYDLEKQSRYDEED